ncbi:hypothetical protein D3C73_564990 [compost metagenome]
MHAEVCTGRHGVVGAVDRAEQAHWREDQRTQQHTQHNRPDARLERQAEQDRETAENGGCKGVGTPEDHPEQVRRACGAFVVRDLFDPVGFNLRKALVFVVVIHDQLRS